MRAGSVNAIVILVALVVAVGSPDGAEAAAALTLGSSLPATNAG